MYGFEIETDRLLCASKACVIKIYNLVENPAISRG